LRIFPSFQQKKVCLSKWLSRKAIKLVLFKLPSLMRNAICPSILTVLTIGEKFSIADRFNKNKDQRKYERIYFLYFYGFIF